MVVHSFPVCNPSQQPAPAKPVFLTVAEAAKFLKMSPITLNGWRCCGIGPRFYKFGRAVRYAESDLLAYANASIQQTIDSRKG
jgi:hypothetical protein